ncbi:MAG TPA: glycogen synthase [Actinomycetes bacterium]|nr:glycogen synthase [Actinomycetes bacterium]
MRVALLTREYPPEVYGGAGVHVEYLARELARLVDLEVHCFGGDRGPARPGGVRVTAYPTWSALEGGGRHLGALRTVATDLLLAAGVEGAELVHSHTWYANLGGHLAKLLYGVPHVVTVHSLEPLRPWKAEQLGGGYHVSTFCERTALEAADRVVAVSAGMAADVLATYPAVDPARVRVIHNGIDSAQYRPDPGTDVLEAYGVDPARPSVVFVGRITRQKGVPHLLDAALVFDPAAQLVLCAGAPDTPELGREVAAKVERLRRERGGVVWIEKMLERREVVQLLSHATAFVCPSVYEPLGIVNLEAMACETAVVASAVGGIPEVVADGETGLLVPLAEDAAGAGPRDPARFAADLAAAVNRLLADPALAERMGRAGRRRAVERFDWAAVAADTAALYAELVPPAEPRP